jgi:hypothetical protein
LVSGFIASDASKIADSALGDKFYFADSAIIFRRRYSAWNKAVDGTARKSVVMAALNRAVHHLDR